MPLGSPEMATEVAHDYWSRRGDGCCSRQHYHSLPRTLSLLAVDVDVADAATDYHYRAW